ncbi:hypothetical protein [Metabacillus arenae]|nr:hypothetical protein [Metabacillus arenae]
MKREFLTPEEIEDRRERNKKAMMILFPVLAVLFGGGITYLINLM